MQPPTGQEPKPTPKPKSKPRKSLTTEKVPAPARPNKSSRTEKKSATVSEPASEPSSATKPAARERAALVAWIAADDGKKLTRNQQRDLDWFKKQLAATAVEEFCRAVPKGVYCELSGRQHKLVDDAAELYGLPIGDASIDLKAALTALHDFIASHARLLAARASAGEQELREERLRLECANLEIRNEVDAMRRDQAKRDLIRVEELAAGLSQLSAVLRQYARRFNRIDKKVGAEFEKMLDRVADMVESGELRF